MKISFRLNHNLPKHSITNNAKNFSETTLKKYIETTEKEWFLPDGKLIVSKTNTKGIITYCNEILIDISGFSEDELIGKQHNVVRHPSMPRSIFHLLWKTIQEGVEFNGYVKNLRKDGGFYWVFANITPSYDTNESLIGYYSVRRKPRTEAISIVNDLYAKMLAEEKSAETKNAIENSSRILNNMLDEKGMNYDEFIFSI